MNAIIENSAKFFVSALLASIATLIVGGAVAVSAGTPRAADVAQQGQDLQAHTQVATVAEQA